MNPTGAPLDYLASLFIGVTAGFWHFGGLWWTLGRLSAGRRAEFWLPLSFILRTAVTLGLLYMAMDGDIWRLGAALAGLFLARLVVSRRVKALKERRHER